MYLCYLYLMMHVNNNYKKLLLTVKKFSDDFMNERTQPKIEKRPFFEPVKKSL